jgi:hypothetical protein
MAPPHPLSLSFKNHVPPSQPHSREMPRARPVNQAHHGDGHGYLQVDRRRPSMADGLRTPTIEDQEHRAHGLALHPGYLHHGHRSDLSRQPVINEHDDCMLAKQDTPDAEIKHLTWSQRMKHVTWAWFTLTMATGGIANVLHTGQSTPVAIYFAHILQFPTDFAASSR